MHWIAVISCLAVATVEPRPGVVYVVGGVSGLSSTGISTKVALALLGLPHEVRDFVWTHGRGQLLRDLQDFRHVEQKARELAEQILEQQANEPRRAIFVIAKSGGAGIALRAAEMLPDGCLRRMVLLSAAVSTDYDLRPALRGTQEGIVSYYSRLDQFVLNWGTSQFGTIDRHYGPSAGLQGFGVPLGLDDDDDLLYRRLVQIPWQPSMMLSGYAGGHFGNGLPSFIRLHVAKWLK